MSEFHLGAERFFTGIVRDITQRKQLENELRQRLDDLAEADRQKNEFLAMLAHELRNPLAPMRNALHLMKLPAVSTGIVTQAREMMERQMPIAAFASEHDHSPPQPLTAADGS